MRVMIWSTNNEPDYQKKARAYVDSFFPGQQAVFRNPTFFRAGDIEKADVIICRPQWAEVLKEYKAIKANPDVPFNPTIIEDIDSVPKFKIIPVESEGGDKDSKIDEPELDFFKKKEAPDHEEGKLEMGSLSDSLSSILGDLGETEVPIATPENTDPPKVEKKKSAKKTAKSKK